MLMNYIVSAILRNQWMIAESEIDGLTEQAKLYLDGKFVIEKPEKGILAMSFCNDTVMASEYISSDTYNNVPILLDNGILVFPIIGTIMLRDSCFNAGSNTMMSWLKQADNDPNVKAILLYINSGGGQSAGTWELASTVASLQTYSETLATNIIGSAAYYIGCATQRLDVTSPDVFIGSIGVVSSYYINKDSSVKSVYARTSTKKHGASRALLEKNDSSVLQDNILDPMDTTFINFVKKHRPKISQDALDGLEVVASKAQELNTGLFDNISSLDDTIARIESNITNKNTNPMSKKVKMLVPETFATGFIQKAIGVELITPEMEASELVVAETQLQQANDSIASLTTKNTDLTTQNTNLASQLAEKDSEIATLKSTNEQLTASVTQNEATVSSLKAQLANFTQPGGKPPKIEVSDPDNSLESDDDLNKDGLPKSYVKLYK